MHLLSARVAAAHPVPTWMERTALRPVRAALDAARCPDVRADPEVRLDEPYPARGGQVHSPFRRVFVVAPTGGRAEENL